MRIPRVFFVVLMVLVVGVGALGCVGAAAVSQSDSQSLQSKLAAAQQSLADAQSRVTQLQGDLDAARADSANLQAQLADVAANQTGAVDLAQLRQQYQDAAAQVDSLTSQLADLGATYNATKAQADAYAARIADLQQQVAQLSAATPTPTPTALPLTADNIETALWNRINDERAAVGVAKLQPGSTLAKYAASHVEQMAQVHHTTTYTDVIVGNQAASMAIGYLGVNELVDATISYWKISTAWFTSVFLEPAATFGAVGVLQSGDIFYISFMAANYP